MNAEAAIRREGGCWLLNVKARPGAKQDRIRGVAEGLLLVDVAAAPEDGKATERLLRYLAARFGVARRRPAVPHRRVAGFAGEPLPGQLPGTLFI